jgi:hypothetical protein
MDGIIWLFLALIAALVRMGVHSAIPAQFLQN